VINPIAYQSEYFGIGLLISWALWAVLILYVVLALRHTRWQKYTPLALGWTVVLGLHGWLAPLWQVLGILVQLGAAAVFAVWTVNPPELPLFVDPTNGTRGV